MRIPLKEIEIKQENMKFKDDRNHKIVKQNIRK